MVTREIKPSVGNGIGYFDAASRRLSLARFLGARKKRSGVSQGFTKRHPASVIMEHGPQCDHERGHQPIPQTIDSMGFSEDVAKEPYGKRSKAKTNDVGDEQID